MYSRLKYTTSGASELTYTTGKKLTHATRARGERVSARVMARLGSATASMKALPRQHKLAHTLPLRRVCGKKKAVVYVSSKTPPALYRHTCAKDGAHVPTALLARLGPTIALAHAHVPLLVLFPYGVRAANERRWCIHG